MLISEAIADNTEHLRESGYGLRLPARYASEPYFVYPTHKRGFYEAITGVQFKPWRPGFYFSYNLLDQPLIIGMFAAAFFDF